jgi:2-dehydro-3-deoxygluconokinase
VLGAVGEGLLELAFDEDRVEIGYGGDAANVCVMAARLGAGARLAGRVGSDAPGRRLMAFWRERGVDVGSVRRDPDALTGLYVNETLPNGDHRFGYWRKGSAGSRLEPGDIDDAFLQGLDVVVVTGVTLAVSSSSAGAAQRAIDRARSLGARVACVLNHRPALGADIADVAEVARESDVVIGSREDADALIGSADAAELAEALGPGPAEVVLTDGALPATVIDRRGRTSQPVPTVATRNSGGAGDALAGAYLAARIEGRPPGASLAVGVAAAALSVQRGGCAAAYPTAAEVHEMALRLPEPVASEAVR